MAAERFCTFDAAETGWTGASTVGLDAVAVLLALEVFEVAVEAWRAVWRAFIEYGDVGRE